MSNSRIHSADIDMSESRKISMRMICQSDKDSAKTGTANCRDLRGPGESFKDMIIRVARADG